MPSRPPRPGGSADDLAQVAIDRARTAAQRADEPHPPWSVSLSQALLLLTMGSGDLALTLVRRAIGEVVMGAPGSAQILGALHLRAAVAAARIGRASDAWEHHGIAAEVVARMSPQERSDRYGLQVTPANVAVHGCAVSTELGDHDQAIRLDEKIRLPESGLCGLPSRFRLSGREGRCCPGG